MTGDEVLADVVARYGLPDGVAMRYVLRIRVSGSAMRIACTIWMRNGDRWRYVLRSSRSPGWGWERA